MILCAIFCIITIISLSLLFILINDIKKINEQIDYKNEHESHFEISIQSNLKQIKYLQKKINSLYKKIQEIEELALKKEKEMQTLMSGISHDIRTPFTSMQGYLKLIEETSDEEEKKKYLDTIEYRLETLKTILEDLFLHSKINDSDYQIKKEEFEIYPLICKVLASFYYDFDLKNIEPVISFSNEHLLLNANQEMTMRILQNLVNNALKHGKNYFEIKEENGIISFINNIDDNKQLDLESIFDRFYKGDQARHQNSTGLGLSIVKKLVEIHNWSIKATLDNDILIITINTNVDNLK